MNCYKCQFACKCCKSNAGVRCSGCENGHDEFTLDHKWIQFCPITGESMNKSDDLKDVNNKDIK